MARWLHPGAAQPAALALAALVTLQPALTHAAARRSGAVRYADLLRIGAVMKKARPFVALPDWSPGGLTDNDNLRARFAAAPRQLSLF